MIVADFVGLFDATQILQKPLRAGHRLVRDEQDATQQHTEAFGQADGSTRILVPLCGAQQCGLREDE